MIKRKGKRILKFTYISTFLLTLFLTLSIGDVLTNSKNVSSKEIINYENNLKNLKNSGYWPLDNITIDDSLSGVGNWTWAADQPWCSGTGALGDPYIIENVTINTLGLNYGIKISNSIKYFVIRNVTVYNASQAGISLYQVENGALFNSNISFNDGKGIYVETSNYTHIKENFISNNTDEGILLLESSNNNTIEANIILNNQNDGISVSGFGHNTTLKTNTIINNDGIGINLADSNGLDIIENIVNGSSSDGINIGNSENTKVIGNVVYNSSNEGMYMDDIHNSIISENTVCNNLQNGIYIDNSNNNTITQNKVYNNTNSGIYVRSSQNNTILGNTAYFSLQFHGINLEDSNNNFITENYVHNNLRSGIRFLTSSFNNISKNTAMYNGKAGGYDGITLMNDSIANTISDNIVLLNYDDGIGLNFDSVNNTISDNVVTENEWAGIILFDNCDDNDIFNNIITDTDWYGMYFYNSSNNDIRGNRIKNSSVIGVYIVDSESSGNNFSNNILLMNEKHAVDDGNNNNWNSTNTGNYWDNYTDPDTTPIDGIVDIQYNISGSAGSVDYLPIAEDGAPEITINSPSPTDLFSNTAPSFNVRITDDYLDEMWYTIDGGLSNYTFIANGTIEQSAWGANSDGALTIMFYAEDLPGNIGSAEVIIEKDTQAPIITINSPNTGDIFDYHAPYLNVTVTDPNLDSLWLELDGSNYELSIPIIGTINQTVWAALPVGDYTITLHANDTLGHSNSEAVTITKIIPAREAIGLDYVMTSFLIFVIGGVGVIVIIAKIYTKKRVKLS